MMHTPPWLYKIVFMMRTWYKKVYELPASIKWPLAIFLLLFGLLSLFNPLINGVALILAGIGLISRKVYIIARTRWHQWRTSTYPRRLVKKRNRLLKKK